MDRADDGTIEVRGSADERSRERHPREELWSDEETTSLEPFRPMHELIAGGPAR
jgi:hypothetical protein